MENLDEYIKNLTGRAGLSFSDLTSAQRARAIAWARESGISIDEGNSDASPGLEKLVKNSSLLCAVPASAALLRRQGLLEIIIS